MLRPARRWPTVVQLALGMPACLKNYTEITPTNGEKQNNRSVDLKMCQFADNTDINNYANALHFLSQVSNHVG